MSSVAYLSLGSNIGDRESHLGKAIRYLEDLGTVKAVSSLYDTEPMDVVDQPQFLNCAVALETTMEPEQLMSEVLRIEQQMGRVRTRSKGPRIIDIDILLFGGLTVNLPGLTIPHPAMHQRRFVLEPLAEIAPDVQHPFLRQSVRELLSILPAGQAVRRVADDQRRTTNDSFTEE